MGCSGYGVNGSMCPPSSSIYSTWPGSRSTRWASCCSTWFRILSCILPSEYLRISIGSTRLRPGACLQSLTMLDLIREAASVIEPVFRDSPQYLAEPLGDRLGMRMLCKVETINPICSFKGRGCEYLLHRLSPTPGPL